MKLVDINIKKRFFIFFCILQFFIASIICIYFSSQENINLYYLSGYDKILHLIAYFIYGVSLQIALRAFFINKKKIKNKNFIILVIVIGFLFAISDEIHQYFVPGRFADIGDLMVDFIGISLSLIFIKKIKKYITLYGKTVYISNIMS